MNIQRIKDNKSRYKQDDYRMLNEFYKQKIQQVHIVGEYANLMVKDYNAALQYVQDYFQMDYKKFVAKYFKGERVSEIQRNLTPQKYKQLFGQLSKRQMEIISDKESRCIVVAAGPGSGKTRVLVHKLASLLLLEDVKHEQLLMLTFSRAAATEFKQRLMELIGNAAHFIEIKTFHSYCFDLLGRIGNLEDAKDIVSKAAKMINQGEVEPTKIGKTVLVIDEAQDMGKEEYDLVNALIANNEEMRVIAVGDDDQNIYEFRGSNSRYMYRLTQNPESKFIEMTENYRSTHHLVNFANEFAKNIGKRMKSTPIISMRKENGWVGVTYHQSKYMYQPLVEELLHQRGSGTSCVLTQTNEEAVILTALLRKHAINSKLIQSMDGFLFWNMAEMRYFLRYIEKRIKTPLIPEELWEKAKHVTYTTYEKSKSLTYVKRCIELFEQTNKVKYHSDFKEFVFESSVEDFCDISGTDVVVSTIHKAKELLHQRGSGTSCVLTQTNEEAVILTALLRKHAINSKLIQSMDGFLFWNMAEMRYFLRYIEKRIKTPLIPEELWEKAKHVTYTTYEKSKSLTYVKRCIELFEQTNKVKYHSDFKEFVFESSVEDFCDISGTDVVVSTIHKAKGREFDNVYMLISDNYSKDDHLMRRYYVGMTRAKNQLFIHTNGNCFNHISADRHFIDRKEYAMPEEIVLQLSHKDVFLKFFKGRKQEILALRSGDSLIYKDSVLYTASTNKAVAKLSQNMQATMCEWEKKGYKVRAAYVRFIVAWKSKDSPKDEPETAVLLADLLLSL